MCDRERKKEKKINFCWEVFVCRYEKVHTTLDPLDMSIEATFIGPVKVCTSSKSSEQGEKSRYTAHATQLRLPRDFSR